MSRQSKEQEKQEQQVPGPKREKSEVQPFYLPGAFNVADVDISVIASYNLQDNIFTSSFPRNIFHPPSA